MGLWDALTRADARRSRPTSTRCSWCPSAAITLRDRGRAARRPGIGSVCFRAAEGAAFAADPGRRRRAARRRRRRARRRGHARRVRLHLAGRSHRDPTTSSGLCTDLHAVNTALEDQGFGAGLLCSLVAVRATPSGRRGRAGLPLQAGHVLPVRADRPASARQPARAPGPRPPRRRAADGAGPAALARALGRARAVSPGAVRDASRLPTIAASRRPCRALDDARAWRRSTYRVLTRRRARTSLALVEVAAQRGAGRRWRRST